MRFTLWPLPVLASFAAALDTSPPCIKSCYDSNPGPRWCKDIDQITDEILSRCTCSSFDEDPPLLTCLQKCPKAQLTTYISGANDWCMGEFFPGVEATTAQVSSSTAAASSSTTTAGDRTISAASTAAAESTTTGGASGANWAVPTMLAVGGVLVALAG